MKNGEQTELGETLALIKDQQRQAVRAEILAQIVVEADQLMSTPMPDLVDLAAQQDIARLESSLRRRAAALVYTLEEIALARGAGQVVAAHDHQPPSTPESLGGQA